MTNTEYEGTEGLEFYLLPDGTYGVKAGLTRYLENIVIPSVYRGKAVTTIMENGFEAMRNLKTITMPNSITTIEKYAFNDCDVLETADISDTVTSIGAYAFNDCAVLETADIPDTVTSIGAYAFNNCTQLINVNMPNTVVTIGEYAFYGCELSVALPEELITLGDFAFASCTITNGLPSNIEYIGEGCFRKCNFINTAIIIPQSVKEIGPRAFYQCSIKSDSITFEANSTWQLYNREIYSAASLYRSKEDNTVAGKKYKGKEAVYNHINYFNYFTKYENNEQYFYRMDIDDSPYQNNFRYGLYLDAKWTKVE